MRPVLELVQNYASDFRFIHHRCATRSEFDHMLGQWSQARHREFPMLMLAFHGEPGVLFVGDNRRSFSRVTLDDLTAALEGRCAGRVVHLGGCSTAGIHGRRLRTFLQRTGALAVTGYRSDINWLKSAAFEVQMIGHFYNRTLTAQGVRAVKRDVQRDVGRLAAQLKFHMVTC